MINFTKPIKQKLIDHSDDSYLLRKEQEIPQEFLDANRRAYNDSLHRKSAELERYASIPVTLYYKWLDEGFDCAEQPKEAVVARLKRENLHAFLTSSKVG